MIVSVERGYQSASPLEMLYVPPSDKEAARIRQRAPKAEAIMATNRDAILDEAIRNSFAFIEVWGRKGGSRENQVACISTWLTWDRQTPIEEAAKEIVGNIAGEGGDVELVPFGPYKLVAFVRGKRNPYGLMERLVDAPREPYKKYLKHLAVAQNEVQDMRKKDVLDPEIGSGQRWVEVFEGKRSGRKRAYEENGGLSMWWGWEEYKGQLWAIPIDDGMPMSLKTLAFEGIGTEDTPTPEMLLKIEEFLTGDAGEDRFVIQFDNGRDVSCCRDASNAQHEIDLLGGRYDPTEIESLSFYQKLPTIASIGELARQSCADCGESLRGEHACKKQRTK